MKRKKAAVKYNCFFLHISFFGIYKGLDNKGAEHNHGPEPTIASIIVNILPVVVIGSMTSFLTRFLRYN